MSGDNFTAGKPQARPALSDVTNRPIKRGFSLISKEESDSQFAKQVCLGVENLIKEKSKKPQLESNPNPSPACTGEIGKSKEELVLVNDKVNEVKEGIDLSSDSEETIGQCDEGVTEVKDLGIGKLASSKGGSIEWSKLPKTFSQASKPFELERCGSLKNDGCVNLNAGGDLPMACSCSFCLKAAYIWSDLHYQDIKGRISVLRKSQKEASILVQKSGEGKQTDNQSQGNANNSAQLESDLTNQWKSLFLNMEDIFLQESSQLQASFTALKDLRENCKMGLERITGMTADK
ncbi:hypothetical protein CCACVL1_26799 [Corchorus capsularis]|uniref:Uncharacterized protein n=1 Tax=Corchorus capsularis TaxID=210143 RepID=A0A1R3GD48_COCAP|nr:hypothetical protein CCACVL1_26799 [Corchorus capsularis]